MALASLPCNADFESKWILSTRVRFFELSKVALKTLPVSQTYCFAGIDPGHFCNVTYGDSVKLQSTLHEIYVQYGPVDLLLRGCDDDGKWYFKCAQPGHKYGPAKAVICVSPAKTETAAAGIKPRLPVVVGILQESEDWEELVNDEQVVEDDWVRV